MTIPSIFVPVADADIPFDLSTYEGPQTIDGVSL